MACGGGIPLLFKECGGGLPIPFLSNLIIWSILSITCFQYNLHSIVDISYITCHSMWRWASPLLFEECGGGHANPLLLRRLMQPHLL